MPAIHEMTAMRWKALIQRYMSYAVSILILRSAPKERVSKDEASWFETHRFAMLLTMRRKVKPHLSRARA
jgi:hypothetical protein